jgi:hypothetical protein
MEPIETTAVLEVAADAVGIPPILPDPEHVKKHHHKPDQRRKRKHQKRKLKREAKKNEESSTDTAVV